MAFPPVAAPVLELGDLIAAAEFAERHERFVPAPVSVVWPAVVGLTEREVRVLRPLVWMRSLLSRDRRTTGSPDQTMMAMFADDGFLMVRVDEHAEESAALLSCAAGRFWSMGDDSARRFDDADGWRVFAEPGNAKLAWSMVATAVEGGTLLVTETRVVATDERARRAFGRYWFLIRRPSGLIRRSWLAAIARRATASP